MKIFIKNMICKGSKYFVLLELEKLGINYSSVELGEITFVDDMPYSEIKRIDDSIHKYGLEIMFRSSRIVNEIRVAVLGLLEKNVTLEIPFSKYMSETLGISYSYLNEHFTDETGFPIEEYYIEKRYERGDLIEPKWSDVLTHPVYTRYARMKRTVKN